MKKSSLFVLVFATLFMSCQNEWYEETPNAEPRPLTYEEELAVIKNYTTIDTINNCYSVTITDEIMQNERLTEKNVKLILQEISKINQTIREEIKEGIIATLTLNNCYGFKSYTANIDQSDIKFIDVPETNTVTTRGGNVGRLSFWAGNWDNDSDTFVASDHVTSQLYVNATGFWNVTVRCNTGTSSYGNTYSASGSGSYSANRYWWWTGGGSAPFRWTFVGLGPVGGEANGYFALSDTY